MDKYLEEKDILSHSVFSVFSLPVRWSLGMYLCSFRKRAEGKVSVSKVGKG